MMNNISSAQWLLMPTLPPPQETHPPCPWCFPEVPKPWKPETLQDHTYRIDVAILSDRDWVCLSHWWNPQHRVSLLHGCHEVQHPGRNESLSWKKTSPLGSSSRGTAQASAAGRWTGTQAAVHKRSARSRKAVWKDVCPWVATVVAVLRPLLARLKCVVNIQQLLHVYPQCSFLLLGFPLPAYFLPVWFLFCNCLSY